MLKPDPVERAKSLLESGRYDEAVNFTTTVSRQLGDIVTNLEKVEARAYSRKFEAAAISGDFAAAEAAYQALHQLRNFPALADAAVERRYLLAMFAAQARAMPLPRKHRHMALVTQLRRVFALPGDIAECGCFRGLSSWMICATLNEENGGYDGSGYHIFDSFAGLSTPVAEDNADGKGMSDMMQEGAFACTEEQVRRNLAAFPAITYHPGWLPQSLEGLPERLYRFVHVDVDLYEPTVGILDYFYPRLVTGGLILTDDYGWPGTRRAFDQFAAKHAIKLRILDGNQALVEKA